MRFGVVLKKQEGMLKKLETPYKLGLASKLGNGKQKISWVQIDDLVQAITFIINNSTLSGPCKHCCARSSDTEKAGKDTSKSLASTLLFNNTSMAS